MRLALHAIKLILNNGWWKYLYGIYMAFYGY